ncbi:AI-2E family transporter [Leptolyngbya sp. PCC 6406]|uniref:AI-2E family transporter n=1 Tax=Leptolyngbya sp. PCC 6406 TaxID=1173264 RepID=UPI0002ACE980|nr:AI-2E family transporter [Leptolyngbya sp. PCC 6406]
MKISDWIGLICLLIALAILWRFRQIVLLLFAAMVIAIALNSIVRRFVRQFRIPRGQAVALTLGLVFFSLVLFVVLVLPLFISQFEQVLELVPKGFNRLREWGTALLNDPPLWLPEQATTTEIPRFSDLISQFWDIGGEFFSNFFSFFSESLTTLLQLLLLVVISLMLLIDPLSYRRLTLRLFPSWYRRRADEILTKCEDALMCWLVGVSISSLFVATLSFAGLLVLRVPFPFANAMLAGIFNFIPNIGPTLSAIFPIIVALSQSFGSAIAVIVLYVLIQNLESYWLSPMLMQQQVSLLPAATLTAQIFFATFLGPAGLILALPLAVVCKTWLEEAWIIDILEKDQPDTKAMPALSELEKERSAPEPSKS